ncbi:MAG: peptidylprolyl isomerase [Verrucomicrobiaceae bacterium]
MKIISHIFAWAILLTSQSLVAQQAPAKTNATTPASKTAKGTAAKKPDSKEGSEKADAAEAAAKTAAAQERKQVHTIAVLNVRTGRTSEQVMFEIFPDKAPGTVKNFRENVEKGTYNGLAFHRAVKDYLVQTGDPVSKDDNSRDKWGLSQEYTIPGEFKLPHTVGAVAMARRSDKTNPERKSDGTQFYFVLGDMSGLDGQYTIFGQVISGLDVLRKISRSVTDSNDCPVVRVEIKKMQIIEQQGSIAALTSSGTGKNKHKTKPDALKGPMERFIERIW